ncbi:phage tail protein [Chryseobacterium sp. ERMR1:04]|uniref:phage tail protein n=1 Tax=Chryseobacterium sp. ERMR1:04 TaxID=1705393 RepID=UPI0006C8C167|nr:phage tail protein [Chryseobacterium sp. ERMR1:04]KPH15033.1 glycerol acyltransferase [Chryseobacterium sp. ERMR1:04]
MALLYPPTSFSFIVNGISTTEGIDSRFQSISGLSTEIMTEEYAEGGENRFLHQLPLRPKYDNLVLKRGLIVSSGLISWCRNAMENFQFEPRDLIITLSGGLQSTAPLMVWNVVGAYPVKWNVSEFNAEESKLAIETIELKYRYFTIPSSLASLGL